MELETTTRMRPRPVWARFLAHGYGTTGAPIPTEEEKADAIRVLRDVNPDAGEDALHLSCTALAILDYDYDVCSRCLGVGALAGAHTEQVNPCPSCGGTGTREGQERTSRLYYQDAKP